MVHLNRRASIVMAVVVAAILIGGCKTDPNRGKAKRAVVTIAMTRNELAKAGEHITATVATLQEISKPDADLPGNFKKLTAQITEAEAQAARAADRADDMRTRAAEYVKAWQAENQTLRNPDLKASADARAQKIADGYNDYALIAIEARKAYVPFIQGLKDIRQYLASDLTPGGIDQAKPTITKTIDVGNTLNQRVAALVSELNSISADMTPTGAPPK